MPILWRYVLKNYLPTFFLCVVGFVSILLVTKIQEIAHLISLNLPWNVIVIFTLCQIPYMIPIAISISGVTAAILLCKKMSYTQEIMAFRSSGLSLKTFCTPILLATSLLSIVHFIITAEVIPHCRLYAHNLIQNITTTNPLLFIKKTDWTTQETCFIDMKVTQPGKEAEDVIIAVKNRSNNRLNLMIVKQCIVEDHLINGKNVTVISNIAQEKSDLYDYLIIENQETMTSSATALSSFIQQPTYKCKIKHLPLRRIFSTLSDPTVTPNTIKEAKCELHHRFFPPCITFASIFAGLSLGVQIEKRRKKGEIYWTTSLLLFTLICMLVAKSVQFSPYTILFFYLLPIFVLFSTSAWLQIRVAKGVA